VHRESYVVTTNQAVASNSTVTVALPDVKNVTEFVVYVAVSNWSGASNATAGLYEIDPAGGDGYLVGATKSVSANGDFEFAVNPVNGDAYEVKITTGSPVTFNVTISAVYGY
jgi:hypothetical protein